MIPVLISTTTYLLFAALRSTSSVNSASYDPVSILTLLSSLLIPLFIQNWITVMLPFLVSRSLQSLVYSVFKIHLPASSAIPVGFLLHRHPYFDAYTGFRYFSELSTRLPSLPSKLYILASHLIYPIYSSHIAPVATSDHLHQTFLSFLTSAHPAVAVHLPIMLRRFGILCPIVYAPQLLSLPSAKDSKLISFPRKTSLVVFFGFLEDLICYNVFLLLSPHCS